MFFHLISFSAAPFLTPFISPIVMPFKFEIGRRGPFYLVLSGTHFTLALAASLFAISPSKTSLVAILLSGFGFLFIA